MPAKGNAERDACRGERTEVSKEPGASLDLLQTPNRCGFTGTEVSAGSPCRGSRKPGFQSWFCPP